MGLGAKKAAHDSAGLTLVELIVVVALIGLISVLASRKLSSLLVWRQQGAVRELAANWQFLQQEAANRSERYRLLLDFEQNIFTVRQEILLDPEAPEKVDLLKNLRTKGEQARRAQAEIEETRPLEEEYQEAEKHEGLPLENLYFEQLFGDPNAAVRLSAPLEYPSMGEPHPLAAGVRFRYLETSRGSFENGLAYVRIMPRGASEQAALVLEAEGELFTLISNPATGAVRVENGVIEEAFREPPRIK